MTHIPLLSHPLKIYFYVNPLFCATCYITTTALVSLTQCGQFLHALSSHNLHYCNALFSCLSNSVITAHRSVQNASACQNTSATVFVCCITALLLCKAVVGVPTGHLAAFFATLNLFFFYFKTLMRLHNFDFLGHNCVEESNQKEITVSEKMMHKQPKRFVQIGMFMFIS